MRLRELLAPLRDVKKKKVIDREVTGLAYDSRLVGEGDVFFCIRGLVTDGHLYAEEAVSRGAVAVVVERGRHIELAGDVPLIEVRDTRKALALCSNHFLGYPSRDFKLVGVTGTNGKTTTCYLVEAIGRWQGEKTGLIGTVENRIGDDATPVTHTTPESLDLQKLMREMADRGVSMVAMEVSSHALELERVVGCEFDIVIFTNLTQDHLDFHATLEDYFDAKRRLFSFSGKGEEDYGENRKAIINADDRFGSRLLAETGLTSRSFGVDTEADYGASDVTVGRDGNDFVVVFGDHAIPVHSSLRGRFNVLNCLAAMAAGIELGYGPESVARGAESLSGVPGRFQTVECGQDFLVIVDYAHTPDGLRSLLSSCREVAERRVIAVFGCGGDRDKGKRPEMGRIADELADVVLVTSDNPRSENPMAIIEMILKGIRDWGERESRQVYPDRREAIFEAVRQAEEGDLVVIAGKGHETGQKFEDRIVPFDDRVVAREALERISGDNR